SATLGCNRRRGRAGREWPRLIRARWGWESGPRSRENVASVATLALLTSRSTDFQRAYPDSEGPPQGGLSLGFSCWRPPLSWMITARALSASRRQQARIVRKNQQEQILESRHPATMAAQALGWIDEQTKALIPPVHPATTFLRDPDNQCRSGYSY